MRLVLVMAMVLGGAPEKPAPVVPSSRGDELAKAKEFARHNLHQQAKEAFIEAMYEPKATDATKAEALYLLGAMALQEGDFDTASDDWTRVERDYPTQPMAKMAAERRAGLGELASHTSTARKQIGEGFGFIQNGDFWSNPDTTFVVDSSYLPSVDMAIEWYDRTIKTFPGTPAAETAYERKLFTLLKQKDINTNFPGLMAAYFTRVITTLESLQRDFPNNPKLQAFRFQIGQLYWVHKDVPKAKEWLQKVIESDGGRDGFYARLARWRLTKLQLPG